ncbi:hypothetical protein KAR91_26005 [Candidatus Pacearchaeota archaeon]|nr:hypothetical protein [Candidatus Pacearchaeota archaeon]
MSGAYNHYRKAKKGEGTCADCLDSRPRWWGNRIECSGYMSGYAVGRKNTCNWFKRETKP